MRILVLSLYALLVLTGCSLLDRESDSRYTMRDDKAPVSPPDVSGIPDAVPVSLPYSRGGNKPTYQVWGRSYSVLPSHVGYVAEGTASWYGLKFHGHETANGEIYDIYKMSAAHKSLPIPSFARVTNLDNGNQVIVRVNDRGPFHGDRLIDLSYAAAARLGMLSKGTGHVRVEGIDVGAAQIPVTPVIQSTQPIPEPRLNGAVVSGQYLQVGAYGDPNNALNAQRRLSERLPASVQVVEVESGGRRLHRVLVGPLAAGLSLQGMVDQIMGAGYSSPILVDSP